MESLVQGLNLKTKRINLGEFKPTSAHRDRQSGALSSHHYRPAAGVVYLLPCTMLSSLAARLLWHSFTASLLERAPPSQHSWAVLNFWPPPSWRHVSPPCNPLILFHFKFIIIKKIPAAGRQVQPWSCFRCKDIQASLRKKREFQLMAHRSRLNS